MTAEDHAAAERWMQHATCRTDAARGVDFFPGRGDPVNPAKAICAVCPVKAECLAWVLAHGPETGIWGGTTEIQRRRMRAAVNGPRPPAQCGTNRGYHRHRYLEDTICDPCREAHNRHHREQAAERRQAS